MDEQEKDFRIYFKTLPDWAKVEMVALLQGLALGEDSHDQYVFALEELMVRVDRERELRQVYLH